MHRDTRTFCRNRCDREVCLPRPPQKRQIAWKSAFWGMEDYMFAALSGADLLVDRLIIGLANWSTGGLGTLFLGIELACWKQSCKQPAYRISLLLRICHMPMPPLPSLISSSVPLRFLTTLHIAGARMRPVHFVLALTAQHPSSLTLTPHLSFVVDTTIVIGKSPSPPDSL